MTSFGGTQTEKYVDPPAPSQQARPPRPATGPDLGALPVPPVPHGAARPAPLGGPTAGPSAGGPVLSPSVKTVTAPIFPVRQILCGQVALIAVVLGLGRSWPVAVAVIVPVLAVVALTAVRFRGRWLGGWLARWCRYRLRGRTADLPDPAGPALLRLIAPEAIGLAGAAGGESVFMLSRAAGITAVLQPAPGAPDPAPRDLLPAPDEALAFAAQVVHHAGVDRGRPPRIWIALQALRTVEVHRDEDVRRALGNAVRRVHRRLRRDGAPARLLAEHEVLGTLAALAHVNAGRGQVREEWRYWHSGPITQAAFRLDGWAALDPEAAAYLLRGLLAGAPQASVTVAVTARRSPARPGPEVEAALRIAATSPGALEGAAAGLARLARGHGVGLERLDGRHSAGVALTLPLGTV